MSKIIFVCDVAIMASYVFKGNSGFLFKVSFLRDGVGYNNAISSAHKNNFDFYYIGSTNVMTSLFPTKEYAFLVLTEFLDNCKDQ